MRRRSLLIVSIAWTLFATSQSPALAAHANYDNVGTFWAGSGNCANFRHVFKSKNVWVPGQGVRPGIWLMGSTWTVQNSCTAPLGMPANWLAEKDVYAYLWNGSSWGAYLSNYPNPIYNTQGSWYVTWTTPLSVNDGYVVVPNGWYYTRATHVALIGSGLNSITTGANYPVTYISPT